MRDIFRVHISDKDLYFPSILYIYIYVSTVHLIIKGQQSNENRQINGYFSKKITQMTDKHFINNAKHHQSSRK